MSREGNPLGTSRMLSTPELRRATAPHDAIVLVHSPEWQAMRRVLSSPRFTRSMFLTRFLCYVCERKLQGRESEITEQQIGTHAFGRPATYNPGDDNIVRNYARMLRQRLESYYAEEGSTETLRISMPRGSYIPLFQQIESATAPSQPRREDVVVTPDAVRQPLGTSAHSSTATTGMMTR